MAVQPPKRSRNSIGEPPFIALTASATADIEQKISEAGMHDFVTKPFNPVDLFIKIRTSIASSGE
jgi:CheY-like chemotaxis protein